MPAASRQSYWRPSAPPQGAPRDFPWPVANCHHRVARRDGSACRRTASVESSSARCSTRAVNQRTGSDVVAEFLETDLVGGKRTSGCHDQAAGNSSPRRNSPAWRLPCRRSAPIIQTLARNPRATGPPPPTPPRRAVGGINRASGGRRGGLSAAVFARLAAMSIAASIRRGRLHTRRFVVYPIPSSSSRHNVRSLAAFSRPCHDVNFPRVARRNPQSDVANPERFLMALRGPNGPGSPQKSSLPSAANPRGCIFSVHLFTALGAGHPFGSPCLRP